MFTLRSATAAEFPDIRKLIWQVGINPIGLDWRRFLLAVDEEGRLLGCGQIKPHKGSIRELASIAVVPEARGLGIARAIITHLMQAEQPPLYLTCQPTLQTLYTRFGYHTLDLAEYPAYFRRLDRLARFLLSFRGNHESFSLMRWDGEKNDQ
jgi:N-acetylglutamate synthase-like GNAT family acetyltransferase